MSNDHTILWIARITGIAFALFLVLFSLDVFQLTLTLWNKLLAFVIHSLPSLVLLLVIFLTWRHPLYAGIIFICVAIGFTLYFHTYRFVVNMLIISGIPVLTGVLYLWGWSKITR